jgi:hypothetical protein
MLVIELDVVDKLTDRANKLHRCELLHDMREDDTQVELHCQRYVDHLIIDARRSCVNAGRGLLLKTDFFENQRSPTKRARPTGTTGQSYNIDRSTSCRARKA